MKDLLKKLKITKIEKKVSKEEIKNNNFGQKLKFKKTLKT